MSQRTSAALWASLVVAVLLAGGLRFSSLGVQIPFHDEWHSLLAAFSDDWSAILSRFGGNDRSIPMTLYLHSLVELNRLGELGMWLPSAIGGTLAVVVLPLLQPSAAAWPAAATYSFLLAYSPILVYFSRSARPYSLAAPLAVIALFSLVRWAEDGRRRYLTLWSSATALACWAMPVYLAFCLAPALPLLISPPADRDRRRSRADLSRFGVSVLVALSVALSLPLIGDLDSLSAKVGRSSPSARAALRAVELLSGCPAWLAATYLTLAGLATALMAHRRQLLPKLAGWSLLGLVGSLVLVRPYGLERPFVLARYLLPAGCVFLLFAAYGISNIPGLARRGLLGRIAPSLALQLTTIAFLPLAPPTAIDNFASMRQFHRLLDADAIPPPRANLGGFYQELAHRSPGTLRIIEAPYHPLRSHRFEDYQAIHHQWVSVGYSTGVCGLRSGLAEPLPANLERGLSNLVGLDNVESIRSSGAQFLVLHSQMGEEITHVKESVWARFDSQACACWLEDQLQVQPTRSGSLIVFDLGRSPVERGAHR